MIAVDRDTALVNACVVIQARARGWLVVRAVDHFRYVYANETAQRIWRKAGKDCQDRLHSQVPAVAALFRHHRFFEPIGEDACSLAGKKKKGRKVQR